MALCCFEDTPDGFEDLEDDVEEVEDTISSLFEQHKDKMDETTRMDISYRGYCHNGNSLCFGICESFDEKYPYECSHPDAFRIRVDVKCRSIDKDKIEKLLNEYKVEYSCDMTHYIQREIVKKPWFDDVLKLINSHPEGKDITEKDICGSTIESTPFVTVKNHLPIREWIFTFYLDPNDQRFHQLCDSHPMSARES